MRNHPVTRKDRLKMFLPGVSKATIFANLRARSYLKSYDINMGTFLWIHLILLVQSAVCVAVGTYIDFMFVILISDMSWYIITPGFIGKSTSHTILQLWDPQLWNMPPLHCSNATSDPWVVFQATEQLTLLRPGGAMTGAMDSTLELKTLLKKAPEGAMDKLDKLRRFFCRCFSGSPPIFLRPYISPMSGILFMM